MTLFAITSNDAHHLREIGNLLAALMITLGEGEGSLLESDVDFKREVERQRVWLDTFIRDASDAIKRDLL